MIRAFSIPGYRALLHEIAARGYRFTSFEDVRPDARDLVLRHDIDMSLDYAADMAEIEQEMGVRAVYYLLLSTPLYNCLSARGRAAIARIKAAGHEIGLHFDTTLYGPEDTPRATLEAAAEAECAVLEAITGTPVRSISFHRPAKALLGMAGDFAGRLHSYAPAFFDDIGYCADSRGEFRYGHPLDHPALEAGTALQLVIHPIWWTAPDAHDAPDAPGRIARLTGFHADLSAELEQVLGANCIPFATHLAARST